MDKIKFSCYNKALARQKSATILIADLRQKLYHNFWARVKQNKNIYFENLQGYRTFSGYNNHMNTTQQLGKISEIMADGYHFVQLRLLMENMPEDGDKEQIKLVISRFYNLCKYIEKKSDLGL